VREREREREREIEMSDKNKKPRKELTSFEEVSFCSAAL